MGSVGQPTTTSDSPEWTTRPRSCDPAPQVPVNPSHFLVICTFSASFQTQVTPLYPTAAQREESSAPLNSSMDVPSSSGVLVPEASAPTAGSENDASNVVSILNSFSRLNPTQEGALVLMLDNLATPQKPAELTGEGAPPSYHD